MNIEKLFPHALLKKKNGQFIEAENIFKEILLLSPNHFESIINIGLLNIQKKDYDKSIIYFRKAISINKNNSDPYINLGNIYFIQKKYRKAIENFQLAKKINPKNENAYNNLCFLHNQLEEYTVAINIAKEGLKINPNNYFILNILGSINIKLNKIERGIAFFIKSINSNNNYIYSYINLINILERINKLDLCNDYLNQAKKNFPDDPQIIILEANYYYRLKNFNKSNQILLQNNLLTKIENQEESLIKYHDLVAKNYDNLDQYKHALQHFLVRNNLKLKQDKNKKFDKNIIFKLIHDYKKYFTKNRIKSFTKNVVIDKYKKLYFLVGFPRSGTTLLDSILRTHTNVSVFEEKPLIPNIRDQFFLSKSNRIDALSSLKQKDIMNMQKDYFSSLKDHLEDENINEIIIDKTPLNIIEIGFINRIFPNSKFILMLRHPCDVVLSCVMADFKINEAMANFYTLEDSTFFYNEIFSLWKHYTEEMDITFHQLKYEDLVLNFQPTLVNLLKFLNLEWEDNLINFNKKALERKKINTPSYSQVIEPLYRKSLNRWERYEEIKNVYPLLETWIKEFQYNN